jgi:glutamate-5-semialdehyde dehydrogenase
MTCERLTHLTAGQPIPFGGDKLTHVGAELAAAFRSGDRLIVVQDTGDLLHVPAAVHDLTTQAVSAAAEAFEALRRCSPDQVSAFFEGFAARLESEAGWAPIAAANADDVASAKRRGRSTTRLAATAKMRAEMAAGLRGWRDAAPHTDRIIESLDHAGWRLEQVTAPLGVIGFVFEGRPNVFADAAGVIRGGNAVVFRIGSDALGTARAIAEHALKPALYAAGLPPRAAVLVESPERAAGWAMFSDQRLALAVARGSGQAVTQLGAVARQSGVPVSLHGTGGAWLIATGNADPDRLRAAVAASLDRKACNTLNVCVLQGGRQTPAFLDGLRSAGERLGHGCKLHVVGGTDWLPAEWRGARTLVRRADGDHDEPLAETIEFADLAVEWEWEETPEVSLVLVREIEEAVALFNRHSPQFIVSVISKDDDTLPYVWANANAAFVGNGMTRWVDGQYALGRPELGLSSWQHGRLLARSGVLSGDSAYTIRSRMTQLDAGLHR